MSRYRSRFVPSVFLKNIQVVYAEQHLMYDLNDVLNGIGGSLGLFLGMSLLGLADWAARPWKRKRERRSGKRTGRETI